MKPTKLIGILLFLILSVTAYSASYGFSPSSPEVGERYKIYANLNGDLPSGYDVRISGSSSSSASATKLGSGPKNWYSYTTSSKSGSATIYFKLFKDGSFNQNITSKTLTVKSVSPIVSSVSIPTLTKDVSSKIKFYGSNFVSGMAFTIADASCNSAVTKSSSTYAYIYCTPNASGSKSWVIKDKSGGSALKRGTVTVNGSKPTLSGGVYIANITGGFRINSQSASGQTRYEFYRSTSSGSLGSKIYSGTSRYYSDTAVTHNVTYYYTAKACNDSGCTTSGQNYKKYLVSKPVLDSGVSISSITNGLGLRWNAATGSGITYKLYRSTSSSSWGSEIYSGTSLTKNDTSGLVDGTMYYYRVKACNEGGCVDSRQDSFKYESPDSKPTISIQTFPTTVDTVLSSSIEYKDDKALTKISYKVYTYGNTGGSHILYVVQNISGTSYTKSWSINTSNLTDGTYEIIFFVSDGKTGVQSITKSFTKKGAKPQVTSFKANPTTPKMFEPITFTAISDIATSNVKFKCGGGTWQSSTATNSNKTWSYTRDVGLKSTTTCYVDIDGDGNSDKTLSVNVGNPKFVVGKSNNAPKEGDSVIFTVSTDKIESDYKLQIKFSSEWLDMIPSSNRKSWTKDRVFESQGTKTVYFRILNPSNNSVYNTTTSVTIGEASTSEIVAYLNQDTLVKKMSLDSNDDKPLSRSDAVVLIDRMRALGKNSIDKNMDEYYNPFADVPQDAEYLPSLMRLAYYKSNFETTTINKATLFNPMRHTTREEFVKMAMNGFDIPKKDYDLSSFDDYVDGKTNMSTWAKQYFETAVSYGVIVGDGNKLEALKRISIKEALIILRRIKEKFGSSYSFNSSKYETAESLDLSLLYHKTIGFEYEPRYYKPNDMPIKLSGITVSNKQIDDNGDEYYTLRTNTSSISPINEVSTYYWWTTDKGYFKEEPSSTNYEAVRFYSMSTEPNSNYHITVNGGDNIGYVDSAIKEISASLFSYPESIKVASGISSNLDNISLSSQLIANKLFTVDLDSVSVKKTNIELGVDQVTVTMEYDGTNYQLFHGTPSDKKARFVMGDYAGLYGKTVTLKVELYSQAKKFTKSKTITYLPQFTVRGKVYNATSGTQVTTVMIGGQSVLLDEDNEFYYILDRSSEISGLEISTKENSEQNHFEAINVDLTYESPSKYVVLTGEDARLSLNLTVSPIHVPSNESVKFTLTADENIPTGSTIDLEDGSCNTPSGLGSKKVEITCTTPSTDSIKHVLMSINSTALYGDGLTRTVVVDKALNDADDIETVKNQLSIPSYTADDIYLPTELLGVVISWSSSKSTVISSMGKVTQQSSEQSVTLTATLSKDGVSDSKEFTVTVPPKESALDTDGDGTPDSEDLDDDNDGIVDTDEIKYGFDPLDASDADYDSDGDGVSNIDEIKSGANPTDKNDYPTTGLSQEEKAMFMILLNRSNFLNRDSVQSSSTSINLPALFMIEALKNKEESK